MAKRGNPNLKKGVSGNPNGRPKGAINKDRKVLREALTEYVQGNSEKFYLELNKLTGKEFIDRFISLLEYTTPKLNRTDLTNDGEKFDFSVYSDAELINELRKLAESIPGKEGISK